MPVDSRQRARLERNITAFYAFRLLIGLQFLMPIWVIYLTEKRGFSIEQVTLLDAPFWLALVLLEVPTGLIADRFGRRVSLLLGALTNTIGITVFAMAANYPLILLSYLVWGAAFTFYSGADAAFLFDTLKALGRQAEYARIFGRSMAFGAATGIVATLSGPLMAARTDLVVPIYASAVSTGLAFIVILGFMYEPPHSHADEGHPGYVASVRLAFGAIWKSPELRTFVPLVAASTAPTWLNTRNQPTSPVATPWPRRYGCPKMNTADIAAIEAATSGTKVRSSGLFQMAPNARRTEAT